ncbi:WecB/TagA/CpsF family glycosyltransferase [Leptolyngbya ohadii]|uniref:WecB/TagA/CpsF family glycosyltransferase n=1 Tax=Leptolyngbya ohadii TaxID=1962290 RepID=UPI00117B4F84|nr:WecB/TagA/CpsF family glycosyltransferase [Leptolyngbya ohadii]
MKTSPPKMMVGEDNSISPPSWTSQVGLEWLYRWLVRLTPARSLSGKHRSRRR